jgi:hypothetical protein
MQKTVGRSDNGTAASLFGQGGGNITDDIPDSADLAVGDSVIFRGDHQNVKRLVHTLRISKGVRGGKDYFK